MKMKLLIAAFFASAVTGCATTAPLENLKVPMEPNSWKVGYEKDFGASSNKISAILKNSTASKGYIREFVPKNETINAWSKLVSIEFLEGETKSPEAYISEFSQKRSAQCAGTKFKILSKAADSVTYSFNFPSCMNHTAQSEISRIYAGNDGLHRLSYAEKVNALPQETIDYWTDKFNKSFISLGSSRTPIKLAQ